MSGNWRAGFGQFAIALFLGGVTVPCWDSIALAEIIPDETLGAESSVVTPDNIKGLESDRISGGAVRGSNLFHSFREFNIGEGKGGYFQSRAAIENIFSRVTGRNPSEILGTLGVLGDANLFFINPNGILFGPNASLDLKGSFLATTADSIVFPDGNQFSATNPEAPPLLTVNVQQPIGLQFEGQEGIISNAADLAVASRQTLSLSESKVVNTDNLASSGELNPGTIRVQGSGSNLKLSSDSATVRDERPAGLDVNGGQTLALVGGEIVLEGGNLTATDGRIELGSVQEVGLVTLNPTDSGWILDYEGVESFQNISFTQAASADASGNGGGSIQVQGRQVSLTDGSAILIDLLGLGEGGTLDIIASEWVRVIGTTAESQFGSSLLVENSGTGKGGDIKINVPRLFVQDGGQISTSSFGSGDAGNVFVDAPLELQVIGISPKVIGISPRFPTVIGSQAQGVGDGGTITIDTGSLIVQDGAFIGGGAFGAGDGPNVMINASNSLQLIGTSGIVDLVENISFCGLRGFCQGEFPSGLLADTFADGKGGNFTINTSTLIVRDGAQISVSTLDSGEGGNVTVNASKSVQLIGRSNTSTAVIPIGFSADEQLVSGLFAASGQVGFFDNREATGEGGNIIINTSELIIRDGAQIAVSGLGLAEAGEQIISADSVILDQGQITANTISGDGGNLSLQVDEILQLRNQSQISTTAGTDETGGDGGNIKIDAPFIIAFPQEDSNITANAFEGDGGNITIDTNGIFGLELRDEETPLSDITASSEFGQPGKVEINTSAIDPTRGLNNLPQEAVESEVAQGCQTVGGKPTLEFFDVGRGGLPPTPEDLFSSEIVIAEWIPLDLMEEQILDETFSESEFTTATPLKLSCHSTSSSSNRLQTRRLSPI